MPGHQADKQFYTYDPAKAKQLLAEAGFPDGFEVTFYGHNVDPFPKLAQAIQNDLAAVGINASIKLMDKATYWDFIDPAAVARRHRADRLVPGLPRPERLRRPTVHAPQSRVAPTSSFYQNPEVDKLYAASASELDPVKRLAMFVQMQDLIMADAPSAILYQPVFNGMYGKTSAASTTTPSGRLQYQEMWKLDGK